MPRLFVLTLAAGLLPQCRQAEPSPADQLPPATQTGANTFGGLVDGQPWTPRGFNGTSNYSVVYDAGLNNGNFDLMTYRYSDGSNSAQYLYLNIISNAQAGIFPLRNSTYTRAAFTNNETRCNWSSRDSATIYRQGTLIITRLDLKAGIIAGTFDFVLYKPGCDTIRVTQGRFDKKL